MRILYVCNGYPPEIKVGGIEHFTQSLARDLVQAGHMVTVIGFSKKVTKETIEDDCGVRIVRLPVLSSLWRPRMVSSRIFLELTINREIKYRNIQLIEVPDVGGNLLFGYFKIPIIVRMHGAHFVHYGLTSRRVSKTVSFFEKRTIKVADYLVAVSNYIKNATLQEVITNKTCQVINNGIDTNIFHPNGAIQQERGLILFVGRVTEMKGVDKLVFAFPEIFEKFPSAKLRIIGPDTTTKDGQKMSEYLLNQLPTTTGGAVEFVGVLDREELPSEYQKASIAIFPSQAEASPLSVLEAMASGTPTVFMKGGPGPEIITHMIDGVLCDTSSSHEISKCILQLLSDNHLLKKISNNALNSISNRFAKNIIINQNIEFYSTCISGFNRKTKGGVLEPIL